MKRQEQKLLPTGAFRLRIFADRGQDSKTFRKYSIKTTCSGFQANNQTEAWINGPKRAKLDAEIDIVGYELPFNRHFYVYQPPRDLAEIDVDLDKVSAEIMELLREVHS